MQYSLLPWEQQFVNISNKIVIYKSMELNDTEYLLNPALFTDSVTIENKFSTEYLLNESQG